MKTVFGFFLSTISAAISAQSFTFNPELSTVTFSIKNFGVTVKGEFRGLGGEFFLDESLPSASHFYAFVDASTVDTGIKLRDKHLRQDDYFDVDRFPKIRIVSKTISRTGALWTALANITIKDITLEATISFKTEKQSGRQVFTATLNLNRLDYGVGQNSFTLGDEVVVHLRIVGTEISHGP